jgi:dUTP pyrophosphatase
MAIRIRIVNRSGNPLPGYQTPGSAGLDLQADLTEPLTLPPLGRALVPTGLSIALPEGYEAQVRPRSGLALKKGLTMLNSPGTIDSDYRGQIGCLVINLSGERQTIQPGERIAQLVVARYEQVEWIEADDLDATQRGAGGFGSTDSHT